MIAPPGGSCSGCGLYLPAAAAAYTDRYNASAGCYQLYGELAAWTIAQGYADFIHQLAVDAYGAQHAGPRSPPIATTFALIGLSLALERG